MTPAQCRAARGLLRWNQDDLASSAKVSIVTVRNFELEKSTPQRASLDVMRRALEIAGVEFVPEEVRGVGVRMRNTAAFERVLGELLSLQASTDDLGRVDDIVMRCSIEERDALARALGERLWLPGNKPTDPRGEEIQDRLTRTGAFRP